MEVNGREEELTREFYTAHARAEALANELKLAAERDYLSVDTKTCTTQYSSRATVVSFVGWFFMQICKAYFLLN